MGILEKISDIEKEIAKTQKNKATEYHLGLLKAKLAKYRSQLLEPSKKGEKGDGFDVLKSGDARIALIGFPSVGKSTLLSTLTKTESEAANYEFTMLSCIPGVIEYWMLDMPGIIEGASQGKGRGRQVIVVARTADVATGRGKVAEGFKHIKLSKFTKKYLVWQVICNCGLKSNIFIATGTDNQDFFCERVPTKMFTAFLEATQLFRSALAGCGILPLRKKGHGVLCCQQRSSGAHGQEPSQHARAPLNRKDWAIVKWNLKKTQKTVQSKLAF